MHLLRIPRSRGIRAYHRREKEMLWPLVLPFFITCICFFAFIVIATICAPRGKMNRVVTFFLMSLISCVAFIPSCSGIMKLIDARRFGVFEYETFSEINDFRVERYLPPQAKKITVDKRAQGFRAKFSITEEELFTYLDDLWERHGDKSVVQRDDVSNGTSYYPENLEQRFGDLGWPPFESATEYVSPIAPNGAGCSIWFSSDEGIAYQSAGYW